MEFITLDVTAREKPGKAQNRRLRRDGLVPVVLYGMQRRNLSLVTGRDGLERFLGSGSHLVELRMGEETRPAIVREVQFNPVTSEVLHVDFQRVDKNVEVDDEVRIVLKGIAKGTTEGGVLQSLRDRVGLRARPRDLPSEIVVDVSHLGVGDAVRVSDLVIPEGVVVTDDLGALVASVVEIRIEVEAPPTPAATPEEGAAAATPAATPASPAK
jgi:large subunit ribosomal protein L25